jgi:hypothetical protein
MGHVLRQDELGVPIAADEGVPVPVREVVIGDPAQRALVAAVVVRHDDEAVEVALLDELLQQRVPPPLLLNAEPDAAGHRGRRPAVARERHRRARPRRQRPDVLRPAHAQVHAFALLAHRSHRP